ncbi:MAG: hypothetical protein J1E29_07365 [Duncaniella sp.]|nr:hypothetical protein [Duncaniella sp.]
MKLHTLLISASIATLTLMASCASGGESLSDKVATAELVMSAEDVVSARRICDDILSDTVTKGTATATELARLSILYMQINERTDDNEAVELAAGCYRDAFQVNADSARWFYDNLPVDQLKYAMMLSSIVHSVDNPTGDYPHDGILEYDDSIPSDI